MNRDTSWASQPHHDGSGRYLSNPAPALGDHVTVRLRVPSSVEPEVVHVRTVIDGEPEYTTATLTEREPGDDGAAWWEASIEVGNPTVGYRFLLETPAGTLWVNGAGSWTRDVADRDDFVVSTYEPPPDWLADTVGYQIFPDRFARSGEHDDVDSGDWAIDCDWDTPVAADWQTSVRQLFRGDLTGVRQKLDHLEQLGVNLIYLTPFFPAGSSHRYDAAEFDHVDPLLGGDAALAELVDAAHARGIRVIGDLTTNHSGNRHEWFQKAQADASSEEASYYFFTDHPDGYVGWFDVPTLPKFDLRSPALRKALVEGRDSIVGRWLDDSADGLAGGLGGGLDGWRIDVGNMTGRLGAIDVNHDVFRDVRRTMADVRPDAWLVGEHCYDATDDLAGDGWHGVMAYSWFTRPVWSWLTNRSLTASTGAVLSLIGIPGGFPDIGGREMIETVRDFTAGVPWRSVAASMTLLDSHDTARFTSAGQSPGHRRVGIGLLMTMPGVPMVFAGDEVGVAGANSDLARQPFPWDDSTWDHELLATYRDLIALRKSSDALRRGGLRFVAAGRDAIAFVRETDNERVLVHAARTAHEPLRAGAADVGFGGATESLYGDTLLGTDGGSIVFPEDGPSFSVWRIA